MRDANGNIIHTDTIRSNYRRVDGIVKVGRMAGDPPAGTRIPFSEGLPPAPNPTDPPGPDPTDPPDNRREPVAKFGVSFGNNGRVNFSDSSTGGPTSWAWDFGDGTGSTDRNASHKYAAPGRYTVTLTVSNENGSRARRRVASPSRVAQVQPSHRRRPSHRRQPSHQPRILLRPEDRTTVL